MKLHSIVRNASLLIAVGCLALAYLPLAGTWLPALAVLAVLLLWSVTRLRSAFWAASGLLGAYLVLCVIAILLSLSLPVVIVGCMAAILWWDLSEFSESVGQRARTESIALLESSRLRSLAIAVGLTLPLEAAGLWLRLQLPFGVIVILVLLVLGFIVYGRRLLVNATAKDMGQA